MSQTSFGSAPRRLWLIAALALIGFAISIYLTQHYYELRSGSASFQSLCNVNSSVNCDAVAASSYAELISGLPLSSVAAAWYLALFAIAWIARSPSWRRDALRAALLMTAVGSILSIGYLWIMVGVLKTYCLFCLGLDAINLAALVTVLSLKPEGLAQHKPEASQWKTFAGLTAVSMLIVVVLLKSLDTSTIPASTVEELTAATLNAPVLSIQAGPEFPSIGPASAPITIVEFSDFQCPYCRVGAKILHAVQQRYPGKVRVVFRNFPLSNACNSGVQREMHPYACEAAKTSVCAYKQGKFEPVYESIFENQTTLAPGRVEALALQAGLDKAALDSCMNSPETAMAVTRDVEEGLRLGIQSTPTLFVNGRKVEGAFPPPVWHRIIDALLKQQNL